MRRSFYTRHGTFGQKSARGGRLNIGAIARAKMEAKGCLRNSRAHTIKSKALALRVAPSTVRNNGQPALRAPRRWQKKASWQTAQSGGGGSSCSAHEPRSVLLLLRVRLRPAANRLLVATSGAGLEERINSRTSIATPADGLM
jgi:hypothetical protein